MVGVSILVVGKLKESYWRQACAEYEKRLGPLCKFSLMEIAEERLPDNPSPAQIEAALEKEGERILEKVPSGYKLVAACIEGEMLSSPALAERLRQDMVDGTGGFAFVIGSSFGLSPAVKRAARVRISFSPMTFPHQLFRVMLLEQIYRAFQILSNGRYHK